MTSVLFVAEYYWPIVYGGGEINLKLLAEALAENGVEVTVLTSLFNGLARYGGVNGVNVVRVLKTGKEVGKISGNLVRGLAFEKSAVKAVRMLLKRKHFDVVHLIGGALGCAEKLTELNVPVTATIESYIALCPKGDFLCGNRVELSRWGFDKFVRCLLKSDEIGKMKNKFYLRYNPIFWFFAYKRFKHLERNLRFVKLIAISEFVRNLINRNYNLESVVIPNFVDLKEFNVNNLKRRIKNKNRKGKKPVVAYLGALVEHKGARVLLEAVKGLNCRIEFYGDGPLKSEIVSFVRRNKIDGNVFEKVEYSRVPEIYAKADVVVFPSLWPEPFGRIAIEALAAGKAVVASKIGGIEETVPIGSGILVEPGNAVEMRNAIKMLIARPGWRKTMGVKGREFVKKNYSKEIVVKKLVDFYERLAASEVGKGVGECK